MGFYGILNIFLKSSLVLNGSLTVLSLALENDLFAIFVAVMVLILLCVPTHLKIVNQQRLDRG